MLKDEVEICPVCCSATATEHGLCTECMVGLVSLEFNPYILMRALAYLHTSGKVSYKTVTHDVEARCPQQTRGFIEILSRMYQVHLQKNSDYSPANILGAGEIGLMTRVWDKISRLMNLVGFRMEIKSSHYAAPAAPKCESVDDNIMDFTVYGVIWQLLRKGAWGK